MQTSSAEAQEMHKEVLRVTFGLGRTLHTHRTREHHKGEERPTIIRRQMDRVSAGTVSLYGCCVCVLRVCVCWQGGELLNCDAKMSPRYK